MIERPNIEESGQKCWVVKLVFLTMSDCIEAMTGILGQTYTVLRNSSCYRL